MPTLDTTFVQVMDDLVTDASDTATADTNLGLSVWFLPRIMLWNGDPLDVDEISSAFDRSNAGQSYSDALTGGGTVGAAASFTLQSDYLATVERAFRVRHASPIRSRAHVAARKTGQGDPAGAIAKVVSYADDLLTAGAAGG